MTGWRFYLAFYVLLPSLAMMHRQGNAQENLLEPYRLTTKTIAGEMFSLEPQEDAAAKWTVVCFLGTECPLVRQYAARLQQLSQDFESKGVQWLAVFSNQQDSLEDVTKFVKEYSITFASIKDYDNKIADQFKAERTPEVFLLDSKLRLQYRGRIDDQFAPGVSKGKPAQEDLRYALTAVVKGEAPAQAITVAIGCRIGRIRTKSSEISVTYCRDIVPVLRRNCIECHRKGEIGPFELTEYEEVVGWADTLVEVVDNGRMPPWHADPAHGDFANARIMSEQDKELLRKWASEGMPFGDQADLPQEAQVAQDCEYKLVPDLTIKMAKVPYKVPAEGTIDYQYFVVDPGFTEDKWVAAANVTPGNRSVVHHAIVFVRPPDGTDFAGNGWLTAYVPGQRPLNPPTGHARRVPAGSKLVFQMHYTPNGLPQEDLSEVSLTFLPDDQVTHEVFTLAALNQEFEIPPQAQEHEVFANLRRLPADGVLLGISPHMHLRGKSFRLLAKPKATELSTQAAADKPESEEAILLNVPNYDFNWQHTYLFADPIPLSKFEAVRCRVTFDNSEKNPFNPDPTQWVTWGDQTWEEMAVAFFEVARPRTTEVDGAVRPNGPGVGASTATLTAEELAAARTKFVDEFFDKLDGNRDGVVTLLETPLGFRRFGFTRFDEDKNDKITREEVSRVSETAVTSNKPK